MKKIIILALVLLLGVNLFSQQDTYILEQDTSFNYIADSINSVADDIKEIGSMVHEYYEVLGFVLFVRTFKYFIISGLILIFLYILSMRSRKD